MQRTGLAMIAAALLAVTPAWAQQSEMENFTAGANQMSEAQRQVTQQNIHLATTALQAKDFAKARKYAQPVTRADPKRIESWLLLGAANLGLEDWSKARLAYATALRITPSHPEARAGMAIAMARTKDPKAQTHLAWLNAKIAECNGCWQAGQLTKLKADVEAAMAAAGSAS